MIRVTVRVGEPLRRALGGTRLDLSLRPGATLADLLDHLAATYPDFSRRYRGEDLGHPYPYRLFVNRRPVNAAEAASHTLADGDRVHILIPVGGGG
jgi:molybdopterin converting factor small subunit